MKRELILQIMPSYQCNLSCDFCYIDPNSRVKKSINKKMDLLGFLAVSSLFNDIKGSGYYLKNIDIYGGEITCLGDKYVLDLLARCRSELVQSHELKNGEKRISIITNLTEVKDYMFLDWLRLVVSFNSDDQRFALRKRNIELVAKQRDVHLLTLDTSFGSREDIVNYLKFIRENNIASFEIKEYTESAHSLLKKNDVYFDDVLINFIEILSKDFNDLTDRFVNLKIIEDVLSKRVQPYYIFLDPTDRRMVIDFDNGLQYFKPISSSRLAGWHNSVELLNQAKGLCKTCPLWGKCLIEHPREITDIINGCPGHSKLLYWYQSEYKKER